MSVPDQPCILRRQPALWTCRILPTVACGLSIWILAGCRGPEDVAVTVPDARGIYHVRPGDDVQAVLDAAAQNGTEVTVKIHAGTYRPRRHGQAFVRFNRQHDGIQLEAVGKVALTAANREIADPKDASFPAIVDSVAPEDRIAGRLRPPPRRGRPVNR